MRPPEPRERPRMAGVLEEQGLHLVLELLPSSRVHDSCRPKHVVAMPIYSIVFHHDSHRNAGCGDQHVHTVGRSRSCTWEVFLHVKCPPNHELTKQALRFQEAEFPLKSMVDEQSRYRRASSSPILSRATALMGGDV